MEKVYKKIKKVFSEREKITRNKIRSLTTLLSNIQYCVHILIRTLSYFSIKMVCACSLFFIYEADYWSSSSRSHSPLLSAQQKMPKKDAIVLLIGLVAAPLSSFKSSIF